MTVQALVVDTSSAAVTAGVVRFSAAGPEVLAERVTLNARGHAELLAPAVAECLQRAGAGFADLSAVLAGVGPGPFTGLRVGLMTAAAIADATGLPSYQVCSLDAIGVGAAIASGRGATLVAGDARRREIYWACYQDGARLSDPAVATPADVRDLLDSSVEAMAGAGARLYAEVLGLPLLDGDYPTVAGLAACAAEKVLASAPSEALTPLYLRRPDAVEPSRGKQVSQA